MEYKKREQISKETEKDYIEVSITGDNIVTRRLREGIEEVIGSFTPYNHGPDYTQAVLNAQYDIDAKKQTCVNIHIVGDGTQTTILYREIEDAIEKVLDGVKGKESNNK